MAVSNKVYIGDGVYMEIMGGSIVLSTRREDHWDTIYLDGSMLSTIVELFKKYYESEDEDGTKEA